MHARGMFSAGLAWGLAAAIALATPAHAQAVRAVPVDTAGQSLATALTDLARRSGRELLLAAPTVSGRAAPRLKGRYTLDQALPLLLGGSGLAYRRTIDGTYIIEVARALPPPEPDIPVSLPELLVTARSQNTDIRRTENDIQAYKVWSSRDIEQAHSTDINEFLRVMATGDAQIASALQDPLNTNAGTRSEVNLRGMGSNQTLVLVDGRRMPGLPPVGGATVMVAQADVNALPLAAIDRVEILNATAGGIYGAGAAGGAVNIVLKRDYRGADLGATYGITDRGDAMARRLDGRIGFSPDDGRTNLMVAFGLQRSDGLSVGDRDYEARARALRYRNDPAQLLAERPISGGINIFSADGGNLTLDPAYGGASLGASSTSAPASYNGVASDRGAVLLANSGRVDTSLSPDAAGARRALLSQRESMSVIGSVRHRFGGAIEVYGDVLAMRNKGWAVIPESTISQRISLAANAPNNPFQQAIVVTAPLPGLDPTGSNLIKTTRATAGVIVDLPKSWKLNVDYSAGASSMDVVLDMKSPNLSYYTGQIDPLGGQQAFLAAFADATADGRAMFSQSNHFRDRSLRLAGPILDLGGGPLSLTLTAEDRRERVPPSTIQVPGLGGAPITAPIQGLLQSARQYYGELRAPITDRYAGPRGLKGLEFQLALRREVTRQGPPTNAPVTGTVDAVTENATQSSTLYTTGFKVYPLDWLMVRASVSSGFVPPVADQLSSATVHYTANPAYLAPSGTTYVVSPTSSPTDSRRGGEALGLTGFYDLLSGGTLSLKPERARSVSAGVVLTPRDRLRISVDYTRIEKRDEIFRFHTGDISYFLQHESEFPDRVHRAPLTDADRAKGYTGGVITAVDTTSFNIGRTLVEAVDIQGDYLFPSTRVGDFRLRAAATWQPHLKRRTDPQSGVIDYVGYADGPLEWRANGGGDWSMGATTVGFNVSFYGGYRVFDRSDTSAQIAQVTLWQGASRVPSQAYVDLFATRQIRFQSGLKDAQLRFGLQNVLDHRPPILARTLGFGLTGFNYSTYGDPRRRRFELSLVGHF